MTAVGARHALFYDTEAALRLVDGEVRALTGADDTPASPAVERASAEVHAVLASVRDRRAVIEGLESADHADVPGPRVAAQLLAHAARALTDVEERLLMLAELLDSSAGERELAPRSA